MQVVAQGRERKSGGGASAQAKSGGGSSTVSMDEDDIKLAAWDRQERREKAALSALGSARFKKTVETRANGQQRIHEKINVKDAGKGEVETFSVGRLQFHHATAKNTRGTLILNKDFRSSAEGKKAIKEALRKELEG